MKKFLSLSLLTCLIISGCNSAPQSESELQEDTATTTQESSSVEPNTESLEDTTQTPKPKKQAETNSISYYNEAYDFSLEFPLDWEGFKTNESKTQYGNYESYKIDFFLPGYDYPFFAVTVFSPEQWTEILKEDGPKPQLLGQKNNQVFTYSQGQDMSESLMKQFNQISSIVKTFK